MKIFVSLVGFNPEFEDKRCLDCGSVGRVAKITAQEAQKDLNAVNSRLHLCQSAWSQEVHLAIALQH